MVLKQLQEVTTFIVVEKLESLCGSHHLISPYLELWIGLNSVVHDSVFQIRRGSRENFGIIFPYFCITTYFIFLHNNILNISA